MRIIRTLIIAAVWLAALSARAGNADELARIKQNYARMLVPSGEDPSGLLRTLSFRCEEDNNLYVFSHRCRNVARH